MNPVMKSIIKAKLQNMNADDLIAFCETNGYSLKRKEAEWILHIISHHHFNVFSNNEQQQILKELKPHLSSEADRWIKSFLAEYS